jgi:hypothetical protein
MKPRMMMVNVLAVALGAGAALVRAQSFRSVPVAFDPSVVSAPQSVAEALDPQGVRLLAPDGKPVCEIWWSKAVRGRAPAHAPSDVLYGSVQEGAFLGVLHFITLEAEDFRDQKLKPGFYTLRYALLPADSSHADVSSHRDFALLVPLRADTDLSEPLALEALIKLSRLASRTAHPAVMSLVPVNPAYKKLPAVVADDQGNCTLQLRVHQAAAIDVQAHEIELAILLVTAPKEEGGS